MNKELIAKVIQSIQDQPEKHKQNSWVQVQVKENTKDLKVIPEVKINNLLALEGSCQTSACIAGWTLLHEGYVAEIPDDYLNMDGIEGGEVFRIHHASSPEGNQVSFDGIGHEAALILGIDTMPYGQLFYDMGDKSALAQLMFLHETGHLPNVEFLYDDGDDFEPDRMDEYDRDDLLFDGESSQSFTETWLNVVNEKFPPAPIQTTLPI